MSDPTATTPDMGLPWGGFIPLCWTLAGVLLSSVAVFGLILSFRWRKLNKTTEDFVTARGRVPTWRLAWSFFAGAVGAWVIASPSSYASFAGMIGLVFYSLSSGLPFLLIAFVGPVIQRKLPNVCSLSEFMGWRYGIYVQIFVGLVTLLNMSIALLVEYTTVATLFEVYLGSVGWPIVVVIGLLTISYTTVGGLLVSIATDQVQGISTFFLMMLTGIYLAVTFRYPLPPIPDTIAGTTVYGYSAIFVMPVSLFTATVFSEAMWQRAWAAESSRKLKIGASFGAAAVILVVFISGLCGWLAAWAGLLDSYPNANLYMFYGLKNSVNLVTGTINNWIGVLVLLLAAIMSEGAVDSLQNGLLAAFSSFFKVVIHLINTFNPGRFPEDYRIPLTITRLSVLILNIPLIALGAIGASNDWAVLDFFLITNMICCTVAVPVLVGLSEFLHPYYGGASFLISWFMSFFLTSLYGVNECWGDTLQFSEELFVWQCQPTGASGAASFRAGMAYTWYRNGYRWEYFAVAFGTSVGSVLLLVGINAVLIKVFKVKTADREVFGFVAAATSKKHLEASTTKSTFKTKNAGSMSSEEGNEKNRSSSEEHESKETQT